jgi:hypothetical protein
MGGLLSGFFIMGGLLSIFCYGWLIKCFLTTEFEQHFCYAAGAEQMMQEFKTHTHRKRIGGMKQAKRLLS